MDKLPFFLIMLALAVGIFALLAVGWRNRLRRQADVDPLPEIPGELGAAVAVADGQYVASTTAGDWHHAALVFDGATRLARLYVDNTQYLAPLGSDDDSDASDDFAAALAAHNSSRTTEAGIEGGPYDIEIVNPGGGLASAAFSYVRPLDPEVAGVTPSEVAAGELVTLSGSNLTPLTQVVLGADPDTGEGGVVVGEVEFVDAGELRLTLPGGLSGSQTVMVRRTDTGQAGVLEAGVSYPVAKSKSSGCSAATGLPRTPGAALQHGAWILGLALLVGLRASWMRGRGPVVVRRRR